MKKTYSKPEIMFESFTLSTNIAGDCEKIISTSARNICTYKVTDEFGTTYNVFTNDMLLCTTRPQVSSEDNSGEYDGYCYHVPTTGQNLFNS